MSRKSTIVLFLILILIITLTACNTGSIQGENLIAGDSGLIDDIPDDEPESDAPESVDPESNAPESVDPESVDPESNAPDSDEPDNYTPDSDASEETIGITPGFDTDEITDDVIDEDFKYSDLSGIEFWFGSGVGAWCTVVSIEPDGTFNGYFHDSDMGDNGDDYPDGIRYECYFSGKFSPLRKIGDFEYSMICESLTSEGTLGEERIVDGVKLITSTPYGFDNANEFLLYLPGKKADELPEAYLSWSQGMASSGVLTCYGLYNIGGEQGFIQ